MTQASNLVVVQLGPSPRAVSRLRVRALISRILRGQTVSSEFSAPVGQAGPTSRKYRTLGFTSLSRFGL